jgi:hypothetical protein
VGFLPQRPTPAALRLAGLQIWSVNLVGDRG